MPRAHNGKQNCEKIRTAGGLDSFLPITASFRLGEEAQVDYGEGALTRDPKTGRYRRPRLFVMTLRYSRRSFRRVVWKSSKQVWAQLHEEAFRHFGGAVSAERDQAVQPGQRASRRRSRALRQSGDANSGRMVRICLSTSILRSPHGPMKAPDFALRADLRKNRRPHTSLIFRVKIGQTARFY
jgi:hypothetical protein